ncbi:MAG: LysE family translocator [Peptococcaceae bacterium]|nr:LysE family translocator [Peptococcaceae bacterium]
MIFSPWELVSFIGLVILLVIFPGPNMLLVTQSVGLFGKKTGFFNVAGIVTALYIHAIVFALGLSIIMVKSSEVFHIIRIAGGIYLIYIGISSIWTSTRIKNKDGLSEEEYLPSTNKETPIKSYLKGLISCVLNPKAALFFLSFFPQFIHAQYPVLTQSLVLTLVWSGISVTWYSALILFLSRFRAILESQKFKRNFGILTGTALLGVGIKIAINK